MKTEDIGNLPDNTGHAEILVNLFLQVGMGGNYTEWVDEYPELCCIHFPCNL